MDNYEIIKQRAAEAMPYKMAFMKAVESGDEKRISMYESQLMEKANAIADDFPSTLASCVVYVNLTTTVFQYYDNCGDAAQTVRLALDIAKRCQWLDGSESEQALTLLLNARVQLLFSLMDYKGECDLVVLVGKSCETVIPKLKLKNPQNAILQQAQFALEKLKTLFMPNYWKSISYDRSTYLDRVSQNL